MLFSVFRSILLMLFTIMAYTIGVTVAKCQKIDTLKAQYVSGSAPQKVLGKIELSITLPPNEVGTLQIKTNPLGTYTVFNSYGDFNANNKQLLKVQVPNLFVRDDLYCFKIQSKNASGVISTSKELCSLPFRRADKNNFDDKIVLIIKSYQPADLGLGYKVLISSKCKDSFACQSELDKFTIGHTPISPHTVEKVLDAKVRCGEEKTIQIRLEVEGMVSISDTIHNFGFTKNIPGSIIEKWLYATVENDKVVLKWRNDIINNPENYTLVKKFIMSRKDDDKGIFNELNATKAQFTHPNGNDYEWSFTDPNSSPNLKKHDYQLKFQDFCGNESFNTNVSPIFLSQNTNFELIWNNDNDSKVSGYELLYYDTKTNSPRVIKPLNVSENRYLSAETAVFYRIRGKQKDGNGAYIYSNFLENGAGIIVNNPTIFTPDGQGPAESETFKVFCSAYNSFSIIIYDKNGQKMYESTSYESHKREGWNGKLPFTDINAPEGIYVFQVDVKNKVFKKLSKKGSFLLIRN